MVDHFAPEDNAANRPAAMCFGPGHIVVYGNPAFVAAFGRECVGLPAREALIDLPSAAFDVLDAVLNTGRPLGRWLRISGHDWRFIAAPRVDIGTGEVYGVSFHLRTRSDVPVATASQVAAR